MKLNCEHKCFQAAWGPLHTVHLDVKSWSILFGTLLKFMPSSTVATGVEEHRIDNSICHLRTGKLYHDRRAPFSIKVHGKSANIRNLYIGDS